MDIKKRMADVGMSQVDMIFELRKKGVEVQPPMLSSILNGVYTYPKAKHILAECEKIVQKHERKHQLV